MVKLNSIIQDMKITEKRIKDELTKLSAEYSEKINQNNQLEIRIDDLSKEFIRVKSELNDQSCLRKELELELKNVMLDRAESRNILEKSNNYETQLIEFKTRYESSEKKRKQLEILLEKKSKEINILVTKCTDFEKIQIENSKLNLLINDLKLKVGSKDSNSLSNQLDTVQLSKHLFDEIFEQSKLLKSSLIRSRNNFFTNLSNLNRKFSLCSDILVVFSILKSIFFIIHRVFTQTLRDMNLPFSSDVEFLNIENFDELNLSHFDFFFEELINYKSVLVYNLSEIDSKMIEITETSLKQSMSWEASSSTISSNQAFTLPLYGSSSSTPSILKWSYTGLKSEFIHLCISYLNNVSEQKTIKLYSHSMVVEGNWVYSGCISIDECHSDLTVIISNQSFWGNASIAYHFEISLNDTECENQLFLLKRNQSEINCKLENISKSIKIGENIFNNLKVYIDPLNALLTQAFGKSKRLCDPNNLLDNVFHPLNTYCLHLVRLVNLIKEKENVKIIDQMEHLHNNKLDLSSSQESKDNFSLGSENQSFQDTSSSSLALIETLSVLKTIVFSTESVSIKASDELRIILPPLNGKIRISWDFQVLGKGTIGFTIGNLMSDGRVPHLTPYFRTIENSKISVIGFENFDFSESVNLIIFFDNTFSWLTPKQIKYNLTVEIFSNIYPQKDKVSISKTIDDLKNSVDPEFIEDTVDVSPDEIIINHEIEFRKILNEFNCQLYNIYFLIFSLIVKD